ncbi:MAG: hypothetical protein M1281_01805 [Chloroflexi bacterium]|nr:hypothetical protein [Chloroflexota bacterium]
MNSTRPILISCIVLAVVICLCLSVIAILGVGVGLWQGGILPAVTPTPPFL